jgi:hypothetical protein
VPPEVKKERLARVHELQQGITLAKNQALAGRTLEVLVEKGGRGLGPGSRVRLRGEVRAYGDGCLLEVASERSIEVIEEGRPERSDAGPGGTGMVLVHGTVETVSRTEWSAFELVLRANTSEEGTGWTRLTLECLRMEDVPAAGDRVEAIGLAMEDGKVLCYGDPSLSVVMKAVPRTADLISLVSSIGMSPDNAPVGPFTVMAYLRSEPGTSRYLAVGESPEGGSLNIRVRLEQAPEGLHRGDLVELSNCTLYWDTDQMRYALDPTDVLLIEPHGPWKLDLGGIGDQLRFYIGSQVALSGNITIIEGVPYLTDEGTCLLLSNATEKMYDGASGTLIGTLSYDGPATRLYMDAGKGDWAH